MPTRQKPEQAFRILLVEDDPAHAELLRRGLEPQIHGYNLQHLTNGEAALDYLFRRGPYSQDPNSPRPHLILLDLRLPRLDGLEVLQHIKQSTELRRIPVVILTTSSAERDVAQAYDRHANSYLVKPVEFAQLRELLQAVGHYWSSVNYFPWP
ncbi:response regulator [Litorilinea aerophila]|uniref:Response regulator n=1 Tax=Litorilinea aerophila TaxID=1204385 RepID=A0A540VC58_9CHLR|nr:response regulator [Litorilinea aerophila]MCC9077871.1 response regulator [Litorilinea aerophila]GIV78224.1 MAG: response regulator [Litorilinea sp.]